MIYFDNAATSYPKPQSVIKAAENAFISYGGNPGRSGHTLSVKTSEMIYSVRQKAAWLFSALPENTVFTLNCTHALNMAIKGAIKDGSHVIISSLEHNSVSRPVFAAAKEHGCEVSVLKVEEDDDKTIENLSKLIRADTKLLAATVCSNVTGQVLPFERISKLCRRKKIVYIADAAQAAGKIPLDIKYFDFLCMPGHKGLYGPSGTGLLITNGRFPLKTIIEGGTGATSLEMTQTDFLPEQLESGTLNTVGIAGLGAGIDFVNRMGIDDISKHEAALCRRFYDGLVKLKDYKILNSGKRNGGLLSFVKQGESSDVTAQRLNARGFCLRGGYHCAGIAHRYLGTEESGAVRFSPSVFNKPQEIDKLLLALKSI